MTRDALIATALLGGVLLGVSASGCGRRSPLPAGVSGRVTTAMAAGVRAAELYPLGARRYVRLDPETGAATRIEVVENEPEDRGGGWTQRTRLEPIEGGEAPEPDDELASVTSLVETPGGGVAMRSLVARAPSATRSDEALYVFDPALVMAPPELAPGETFRDTCELRIVELDDHARVIKRGTGERRVRVIGGRTLRTQRGDVACTLVRAELVLTMGAIRSETVTDLWVSPGVGVIAESAARVSSVMGVPVRRSRSVRRLEGWLEAPVDRVSARDDDRASRPGGR